MPSPLFIGSPPWIRVGAFSAIAFATTVGCMEEPGSSCYHPPTSLDYPLYVVDYAPGAADVKIAGDCASLGQPDAGVWVGRMTGGPNSQCQVTITVDGMGSCTVTARGFEVCGGSIANVDVRVGRDGSLCCFDANHFEPPCAVFPPG